MGRSAPVADWLTISDLQRNPFTACERLRSEGGVHWVPSVGRYLITSYEAVRATDFDQEIFSADLLNSRAIRAMGHSMLRKDDPQHHHEREVWQPAFRPAVIAPTWTTVFERNAERYLEELISKGEEADLIWDFAAPYAAENLRELLGFHNATHQDVQRWSQSLIDATANYTEDPGVWARGEHAYIEIDEALDEMREWHVDHPDRSLISSLLHIPEAVISIEQIRANLKTTIAGGVNEPRDALGLATWALLTHPDQRHSVETDPSLWTRVFGETIRWNAPVGIYTRQTMRDTVLAGVELPAGAQLAICIHSANRDESVWPNASSFDIHREARPHLAFGKGVHACLGAWVAKAEVAAVGLPALFGRLRGLELDPDRPAEIGGWAFRGMLRLPVIWSGTRAAAGPRPAPVTDERPASERGANACPVGAHAEMPVLAEHDAASPTASDPAPSIAIVGAGPAGCFTAQAIRRVCPDATIDVFDRLPVPYGLIRYGVAADHQGTKSVARQLERLFTHDGVVFHGNVDIGDEVDLAGLREAFDAVVLATGVHADVELDIPGAGLPGVIGSGRLTRLLNGHPDEKVPLTIGRQVIVVGHGNVAIDVVRLLTVDAVGLNGSDIDDAVRERVVRDIRVVHVVGRAQPSAAKFDAVLLRELAGVPGIAHVVHGVDELTTPQGKDARIDAVRELAGVAPEQARVRVEWWFGLAPFEIEGGAPGDGAGGSESRSRVRAVRFTGAGDEQVRLIADTIVTAVGFRAGDGSFVAPGEHPTGRAEPALYVAGWLRRGPRGTIPDQRADARALARQLAEDVASGDVTTTRPGVVALGELPGAIDHDGWRRIDRHETEHAASGRVRSKLSSHAELLAVARDIAVELPPVDPAAASRSRLTIDQPVTIAYGTESGQAELVAEELARRLDDGGTHVELVDLADIMPADLDPGRLHLVICSTYGDGELPTNARAFREALLTERPDLTDLTYAIFGLGDRSYATTYSRGSELLDETLRSLGASRVGEYGRHDAGGPDDAAETAVEWLAGVFAELRSRSAPGRVPTGHPPVR